MQDGKIAVPFNPGNVIEALAQLSIKDKVLIVGSSANNAGEGNCAAFEELPVQIVNNVDYIIYDTKPAKYQNPERKGGTIIDLSSSSPVMSKTTHHRWVACCYVPSHQVVFEHAQNFPHTKKIGFLPPVKDWMENSDIFRKGVLFEKIYNILKIFLAPQPYPPHRPLNMPVRDL